MVIVKLMGGLGNQMFQYAFGRRLAHERQVLLQMDGTFFQSQFQRRYQLGCFKIRAELVTDKTTSEIVWQEQGHRQSVAWSTMHLTGRGRGTIVRERRRFVYDSRALEASGNIYLEGYWQNEKYFEPIAHLLREEFAFAEEAREKNREVLRQILDAEAVAIHVRRTDYTTNRITNQVHGVLSLDHYHTCVRHVAEAVRKPHFFVFSDDPEWAKNNLRIEYPCTVIDHNRPPADHEDLRLMSACRHFVIANSTFSWWAAWLSAYSGKRVFAPRRWLAVDHFDTSDLCPASWIRV
jgi:hypothetical protein